jgi:mannose-6-phosphate isomerase-like protein (cupin superfamily)
MAMPVVINLAEKHAKFTDYWNPRIVGRDNDNELRVSKLLDEFVWHGHAESDELFLLLKGTLKIQFRDGERVAKPGELIVVPKGVEHSRRLLRNVNCSWSIARASPRQAPRIQVISYPSSRSFETETAPAVPLRTLE